MKPSDYLKIQPPKNITKNQVETLWKGFRALVWNDPSVNYDKSIGFTDPVTGKGFKSKTDLLNYLYSKEIGIPDRTPERYVELILSNWYENFTVRPEYQAPTMTGAPEDQNKAYALSSETLKMLEESALPEAEKQKLRQMSDKDVRATLQKKSELHEQKIKEAAQKEVEMASPKEQKAIKEQITQENLQKDLEGKKIFAVPTKELPKVILTEENTKILLNNAKLTREQIETQIRQSIPEAERINYSESVIKSASQKIFESSQVFSKYQSPQEMPKTLSTPFLASPYTSLINPNNSILVKTFTDPAIRTEIAQDAQLTLLTLTQQHDAEVAASSHWLKSEELSSVYFGSREVTEFVPQNEMSEEVIEITPDDIKTVINSGREIKSFISQNFEVNGEGITLPSVGYTPLQIPASEFAQVDTSKVLKTKSILGGIEGQKTQGELARIYARERARALAAKPIEISVTLADGVAPITFQTAGAGKTTESLFSIMKAGNVPLILTSVAVGSYAINELQAVRSISGAFGGRPLLFVGVGKYNFSIINAGNTTLGGLPLSRFTAGFQLGSKSFNIELTKQAGKVVSGALIKSSGGVVTRTALPTLAAKAIAWIGGLSSWATAGLSLVAGWIIGKVVEKIPWRKIKDFVIAVPAAIAGFMLWGIPGAIGLGVGAFGLSKVLTGGTSALQSSASGAISAVGTVFTTAFTTAMAGLATPILSILIGFPIVVALILFIINSGAYVVPPAASLAGLGYNSDGTINWNSGGSAFTAGGGLPIVCTDEKGPVGVSGPFSISPIGNRAWKITYDLYQGFWCFWNREPSNNPWNGPPRPDFPKDFVKYPQNYPKLFDYSAFKRNPNPPSNFQGNLFWCTWLVIKAYNETGTFTPTSLYTPSMYSDFLNRGKIIPASSASISTVVPGSVVFFHVTTGANRLNHVGIVYATDKAGIDMVQSNAPTKYFRIPWSNATGVGTMQIEYYGLP